MRKVEEEIAASDSNYETDENQVEFIYQSKMKMLIKKFNYHSGVFERLQFA